MALLATMLILMLLSSLLVGFIILIMTDQRVGSVDRDQAQAFYAAHAGLEQMTTNLGLLFDTNYAPTGAQVNALANAAPSLPNINFVAPGGGSGYTLTFPADGAGNPVAANRTILSGPYQGFIGLVIPYRMTATARTASGSEIQLTKAVQTVAIRCSSSASSPKRISARSPG